MYRGKKYNAGGDPLCDGLGVAGRAQLITDDDLRVHAAQRHGNTLGLGAAGVDIAPNLRCAGQTARLTGHQLAALINDAEVCREAAAVADSLLGEGHVVTDRELSLSGDNFAEFELYRPGAYAYLGTGNPDKPHTVVSNHNGGFDVDEDALVTGAALYAGYALARLG